MAAKDGALVQLAIGDGGAPEIFMQIGGIRLTRFNLASHPLALDAVRASAWERLAEGSGERSITFSCEGIITGSDGEEAMLAAAFDGSAANYQLAMADGSTVTGAFRVTLYAHDYDRNNAASYRATLQSSGEVSYSAP